MRISDLEFRRVLFRSNELLAFLSYDEEHHRVAILNVPGLQPQPEGVVGVHHCAFTYATLADLMATYERLRDKGIRPVFPINHGPTTSMYYADPDGNQIELQVDNYDKIEDARSEEHTSELQSLMRNSYAVFC